MSPDSPQPSRQRKAWRFISCAAAVLAAFSLLVSVWLYTQQQKSREDSVRQSCVESNARHDSTIRQLDVLYLKRLGKPAPPNDWTGAQVKAELYRVVEHVPKSQREQVLNGRTATITLIDQLTPKRQCERRVDLLTRQNSLNP